MIPICNGAHWWLLVANIRDNRFDVLNSSKVLDEEKELTHNVVSQLSFFHHVFVISLILHSPTQSCFFFFILDGILFSNSSFYALPPNNFHVFRCRGQTLQEHLRPCMTFKVSSRFLDSLHRTKTLLSKATSMLTPILSFST
jgi:hypothetical protein